MKLMIGCVTPFQVRARVGVNLDAAYTRRMNFWISTTKSVVFFTSQLTIILITLPIFLTSFDRNTTLGWTVLSSGVTTSDVVLKLTAAPWLLLAGI